MNQNRVIQDTIVFTKESLKNAEGGHDWWHAYRVWKIAKHIAEKEKANMLIVELGALLHDIADSKFYDGDEEIGPKKARDFLDSLHVENSIIWEVEQILRHISFYGGKNIPTYSSPELNCVQDADRLDAMGAIGIARTFNYGGYRQRSIYDPEIPPNLHMSKEEYKKSNTSSINHFYEKLLLIKDRMNTETGKRMAQHRHEFMEHYLKEFYKEWEGDLL